MSAAAGIEPPVILGIDLGTQSIRVLAFDARGRHVATASRPTPSSPAGEGSADYDPDQLWSTTETCLREAVAALPSGAPVAGIAVASVGESCVLVDAAGRAAAPALVWHDRRTEAAARAIEARIGDERLFAITGHKVDPIFSLCKLLWMRESWPEAFGRAVRVLNMADWIAFRLCGVGATDFTLASRMLALDVRSRRWSHEILAAFDLDPGLLAPLVASGTALERMRPQLAAALGLAQAPVVAAGGHDHLCGMFAAGAARPGVLFDSMGTAEALVHAIPEPLADSRILDRGYFQGCIQADRPLAYVGAGIYACGGSIEWFRGLFAAGVPHASLIAEAAAVAPGSHGAAFLPHLKYASAPRFDTRARGAFVGLTLGAERGALFRALLEGLSFEARLMAEGMSDVAGASAPAEIRLIGGNVRNALLLDIKASVLGRPLTIIDQPEATALGAALLGGLAAGVWRSLDDALETIVQARHTVEPRPEWTEAYDRLYADVYFGLYPALREVNHRIADHAGK